MGRKSEFVKIPRSEWEDFTDAAACLSANAPLAANRLDEIAQSFEGQAATMFRGYAGRAKDVRNAHGVIDLFLRTHKGD